MTHYEGKVTITLENMEGVKISRPFDVEFDEDLTFGESPFLFKKAINNVNGILISDIEQVTLDVFERKDAAEKSLQKTTGPPSPPETCQDCEALDKCQNKDPRAGCLTQALNAAAKPARKKKGRGDKS